MKLRIKKVGGMLALLKRLPMYDRKIETLEQRFSTLQQDLFSCKAALKQLTKEPIHVVFVCHSPTIWGKLHPVYLSIKDDSRFKVSLVSVPFSHPTFGDDGYHDGGMESYIKTELGVEPISGYESGTGRWINLQELKPDFAFFQTPYDLQFPPCFRTESVSSYARVCYVPYYGILLYKGEVEATTHPRDFFRNVSMTFVAHEDEKNDVLSRFSDILDESKVLVSGSPMIDHLMGFQGISGDAWNLKSDPKITRILWTPRWRTEEGNCHFFDYKDYFINLARNNGDVDFLLRPHPLCFKHFSTTGEFSESEQTEMVSEYDSCTNAGIDQSDDYQDLFLSSDVLVSDMSSMIAEYFVTGKPVVYTHRSNSFNTFGERLSRGFYWVRNQQELDQILLDLRNGNDPLRELRSEIIAELFCSHPDGAASVIRELLTQRIAADSTGGNQPEASSPSASDSANISTNRESKQTS